MRGLFVNSVTKPGQGRIDCGYFIEEGPYSGSITELEDLVENDEAYIVKVSEDSGTFHIKLESENRKIQSKTEGRIEKKGEGTKNSVHQSTKEPLMPGEYENPHKAIETYTEYALEHQEQVEGIEVIGFDWDNVLNEE